MADMNIKDDAAGMASSDWNACPTIYLNDDQCEALGIKAMPKPGTVYMLRVKAVVTRVTAEAEEADEVATEGSAPDISLTLQCADIEIASGGSDAAAKLYS